MLLMSGFRSPICKQCKHAAQAQGLGHPQKLHPDAKFPDHVPPPMATSPSADETACTWQPCLRPGCCLNTISSSGVVTRSPLTPLAMYSHIFRFRPGWAHPRHHHLKGSWSWPPLWTLYCPWACHRLIMWVWTRMGSRMWPRMREGASEGVRLSSHPTMLRLNCAPGLSVTHSPGWWWGMLMWMVHIGMARMARFVVISLYFYLVWKYSILFYICWGVGCMRVYVGGRFVFIHAGHDWDRCPSPTGIKSVYDIWWCRYRFQGDVCVSIVFAFNVACDGR